MARPLPQWVMQKYAELWNNFRGNSFFHSETTKILPENASVIISHLRKNGWLVVSLDPVDNRKRIYKLLSPEKAILGMINDKRK